MEDIWKDESQEVDEVLTDMEELLNEECVPGQISLSSLAGNHSLSTIRRYGKVKKS